MSVSAVVLRSPAAPPKSVPGYMPVATQSDFASYWLPLADAGGLNAVRSFDRGVPPPRDALPTVIQQLPPSRALGAGSALKPPVEEHLLSRIDRLRELLAEAD